MKNPITSLHIQNFKTIKDLKVKPKRINLIIGKPNVGKSNFLEALSLLGGTYSNNKRKFLSEFVRYNNFEDLFYDKETENEILVDTNIGAVGINHKQDENVFNFFMASTIKHLKDLILENNVTIKLLSLLPDMGSNKYHNSVPGYILIKPISQSGKIKTSLASWLSPIKKYDFKKGTESTNRFHEFLWPPFGDNIFTILNRNKKLFPEIAGFFKEYKLKFALRMSDTSFEIQKQINGAVYPTAYNLIADTLQRIIFNIVAVHSNKESILLFEEPEAHSFPPYVKLFAEKVIKSKTNQFFITTHSPFILNTIIEHTPLEEVAVFIATYDKFQTKMVELTRAELEKMLDHGNDIFFSSRLRD
jgi:AAA15 family ATPase/GTPase